MDWNKILPLLAVLGIGYFVMSGKGVSLPALTTSTAEKANLYEEKGKKYLAMAENLREIAKREKEIEDLKKQLNELRSK